VLVQALGDRGDDAGEPTIHDAATAAVERKGSGVSVDPGVAARVGAHLGEDFSGVRVHRDPLAQQATAAIGARAFAYGSDVFLGAGESGGDLGLMAHELTHVAQQGAAGQRAVQRQVQVGDANSPAEHEADQVAAQVTSGQGRPASLLIDDGPVQPGQMLKSQFFEQLRAQVTSAADAELGPIYSAIGCPYIEQYFNRYARQPAAAGETLLRRYAPGAAAARTAADMIPAVVARVREGVRAWRDTGQPPPGLEGEVPGDATATASPSTSTGGASEPLPSTPEELGAQRAPTLASLEADLGPGRPLDGATASRMSGALGADVGGARIHDGAAAARRAAATGATAFAVGDHVVLGSDAPAAGTPEGDALLAHELAHVVQQRDAAASPEARRRPIAESSSNAEDDADLAAAGAVEALHGGPGAKRARGLGARLTSGLQLQRCSGDKKKAAALIKELQPLIDGATWKEKGGIRERVYPKESAAGIARAKDRHDKKAPDLTGLGAIKTLDHFAGEIKTIQGNWKALGTADKRKDAIGKAASDELVKVDVPGFLKVEKIKTDAKGSFSPGPWQYNISEELADKDPLSDDDAAQLCNTTLHESRHAEQHFLAARFSAEAGDSAAQIHADHGIPETGVADKAVALKLTGASSEVKDLAKSMHKSMVTDGATNQTTTDDMFVGLKLLADRKKEAETALAALKTNSDSATISAGEAARDALKAQIADVEKRYHAYRNIPHEADAHEVGDAAELAFKGWK
jgi:hypothetical protein